jgi:uncharacterized protein (TIGR00369 family)
LPYRDANSNPGGILHGGCAASLGVIGAQAVARAVFDASAGPWHSAQIQVEYLAAAIGEDVVADARLLRRGKELCFVAIDVSASDGKAVASALAIVRARHGAPPADTYRSAGDDGAAVPSPLGAAISRTPFIATRGIAIEHMDAGRARLAMRFREENADAGGGVDEGAVIALADTAGAMASWAVTGPGPFKASTTALQLQQLAPAPRAELVAYARCIQRDREAFWSDVEIAARDTGLTIARGTVLYRIVI